ncbi:PEP-CTERM sorting domain-containing protein [Massilia dura]|uniref:PEP-CTERM sorting domain-containing protein n=1 Tax=Pseudoduganella dura TaxID=321982 RepID=A0A6I3XKD1_9BURK|nr:PEP-CTERM sorting domain-containing protein [Pseudoduganella dura]MUI16026.1 PEP-CTERM sorting domain-containing protein [Pseudoduganella dura]GGY16072.1 hypothetical protein GCM10007386_52440 [Pseudoduganella dura]
MRILPALLLAAVAATPAQAAIVKYEFTATVATVAAWPSGTANGGFVDSSSIAGPIISLGDTWTGTLFYETDRQLTPWPLQQPPGGSFLGYAGYAASTIVDAQTGLSFHSNPVDFNPPHMSVHDMPVGGTDFIVINTYASGANLESGSFMFTDGDGSVFSSAVPPPGLDLADFLYATVHYGFTDANGDLLSVDARITSLASTDLPPPVPEPSTYAMLGLGLAALAMTRRSGSRT